MNNGIRIYCVEKNNEFRELLAEILNEFDYQMFNCGQSCIDAALVEEPDLILLNVQMPTLSGLETCCKLRDTTALSHTPVLFLSSNNSSEERLECYSAGGDDVIEKSLQADELLAKVKAALSRKKILDTVRNEAKDASSSMIEIMTSMGEMSSVVHFLQGTFNCKSYESLAKNIIRAHESLGLEVAIEFLVNDEKLFFSTGNVNNPLEESIFEYIRDKGRLVNCGERAAVNYPNVSILIRNMPHNNPDLYGRIRDHVAIIGQGADSKIRALRSELIVKSQRENLIDIFNEVEKVVSRIENDYKEQQLFSESILSNVGDELEDSFVKLGLTSEQEDLQRNIINNAEEQTKALYSAGLALEENFTVILDQIHNTLESTIIEGNDESEEDLGESVSLF